MARSRLKMKGRRETDSFVALPHRVIQSENWRQMSPHAVKLFIDIYGQYRGLNNGDLTAAWTVMKPKGWRSKATLNKALQELKWFGMIELTRQGWRNRCSLYAVTFKEIHECGGKLDARETRIPSGAWSKLVPPFPGVVTPTKGPPKTSSLPRVPVHPAPQLGAKSEVSVLH